MHLIQYMYRNVIMLFYGHIGPKWVFALKEKAKERKKKAATSSVSVPQPPQPFNHST